MQKHKNSAFTLVELIVVITILAILGTIAFISLQGYSTQARDSTRITDLSSMRTSLELFQLDAGKYPLPTDSFSVVYSGSEVWTQGTFGESTFKNVESLDKIPTDPLDDRKYAYSVTSTRQEYQLSGVMEGNDLVLVGVNAGDKEATAVVTGNYNGNVLKTLSGTTCEILSVPSIISSQDETTTELTTILSAEGLVYNGKNNLPSNFRASKYNADGGFSFTSNKLIAYSDTGSCAPLYDGDDSTARTTLLTNLQTAYSGTILANAGGIKNIVNVDLNDSNAVNLFASSLVNNSLGGDVILSSVGSGGGEIPTSFSCGDTVAVGLETYTTIIGADGNCWTSQNMNHGTMLANGSTEPSDINTIEKWCYSNNFANCIINGGLYSWVEAMGFDSSCNTTNCTQSEDTTKSVCGQLGIGWGLPTDIQWTDLTNAGATGWLGDKLSGINSTLSGFRYIDNIFYYNTTSGYWWTSTENNTTTSWNRNQHISNSVVGRDNSESKANGFSVVCIKN